MPRQPRTGRTFLTTRESASRLGVSINAIKTWIREEQLPALRTPGGHHRIAEADLAVFQARLAGRSRMPSRRRRRILVVDDDAALLEAIRDALNEVVPDAVVEIAADGYEALVQVGAFRPDVLVLDLRMPRLDGFEVCRRLKSGRDTKDVRILAMTAYPEHAARERIVSCGADEFLEKPFALDRLRDLVQGLLSRPATH